MLRTLLGAVVAFLVVWVGAFSSQSLASGPLDFLKTMGGPQPLEVPMWENQVIAHIWVNRSNEMIDIKGTDILNLGYIPLEEARRSGMKTEKDRRHFEKALHEALAFISISKIVDQQINSYMVPELGERRIKFAVRQILVENAVNCDKVQGINKEIKFRDGKRIDKKIIKVAGPELALYSNDQLYKWTKECYAAESERAKNEKLPVYGIEFTVDWKYEDGGLSDLRRLMEPVGPGYGPPWWRKELELPNFRVMVEKLPETLKEFRGIIFRELNAYYHLFARELVWRTMVNDRFNSSMWSAAHIVSGDETKKRFKTLRDFNEFIPGEQLEATLIDVKFSGSKATEARTELRKAIDLKVSELAAKIGEDNKNAGPNPVAPSELLRKTRVIRLMTDARFNHAQEILDKLKSNFAADIESGELKVSLNERVIKYDGSQNIPPSESTEARELKLAFSPMIRMIPFPFFDTTSPEGEVHVRLLKEVRGQDLKNSAVADAVRSQIAGKQLTYYSRATVKRLLDENRFFILKDTCSDPSWPCIQVDSKVWADRLLSEVQYPGENDAHGPISFEWSGKVAEVMKFQTIPFRDANFLTY